MYSVSRYLFPTNPARRLATTVEINRIGGFPHSEICGSKVAHTSPQLIAACHVLHRLYMPRHPRIALTSRLRVHTTNDNAGHSFAGTPTRQSSVSQYLGADDYNLSQILVIEVGMGDARSIRPALASQRICASLVPTDTITASILRTHSQCQRGSLATHYRCISATEPLSSSLGFGRVVELIGIEPMT